MSPSPTIEELHREAQAAMRSGNPRAAHQHCLAILQQDPQHADAWFLCGVIAAGNGQYGKAVDILRRAITLKPDSAEYRAELAKQLIASKQPAQAAENARLALELQPTNLPILNTLGTVFSHAGEHREAVCIYEKAAKLLSEMGKAGPGLSVQWLAELYYNLGTSLNFDGRSEEAECALEKAITLQPRFYRAHFALSQLRRATPGQNHLPRLQSLKQEDLGPVDKLQLGHAIARELEDLGQYGEALENLRWAKADRARQVGYRAENDRALFETLEKGLQLPGFQDPTPGCDSSEPIFVVGMPRTGTTLVERILTSHSTVSSAGELQDFPLQVKRMTATASEEVLDAETLRASFLLDPASLGHAYIDGTRPRTGHSPHFIDKLPLNFLYLGLIHRALPNAKLVCLRRDPMDTCLSNYRQLFATNFKYYHYSYDLMDCGRYYLRFDRLMQHWREVIPGAVHELHYEDLVAEPERCSRGLLKFCGLPWEEGCLDFHRQGGSVATASASQVRQPIYRDAVDRWRHYGEALKPLYEMLSAAGCYQ